MTITDDKQLEIRDVLLGRDTKYVLQDIDGLGTGAVRHTDDDRADEHGMYSGRDFYRGRDLVISLVINGDTAEETVQLANALETAWALCSQNDVDGFEPLKLRMPGWDSIRRAHGRPREAAVDWKALDDWDWLPVTLRYKMLDPRLFADDAAEYTASLPTEAGGRTYPKTYNVTYGASASGGNILVENDGNIETPWVATIAGHTSTLTNPFIENVTDDKRVELNIDIAVGDTLELDSDARSVLLNGTASRRSAMTPTSEWWEFAPGETQVRFGASAFVTGAELTLTVRSAWRGIG